MNHLTLHFLLIELFLIEPRILKFLQDTSFSDFNCALLKIFLNQNKVRISKN